MAEMTGKDLVCSWVASTGGTASLTGDFRKVSFNPTVKFAEATAGADAFESFLITTKSATVNVSAVMQTGGTAIEDLLVEGVFGTLTIQPEGTATGKRKYTIPAFSQGAQLPYVYNDTVEFTCDFKSSGTYIRTTN